MFKVILYFVVVLFMLFGDFTSPAHAVYQVKDAFYFMKDDNEFSSEEMDEEARYVHGTCSDNSIRSVYFDCSCIAGAYRQEREKVGPYVPQSHILNGLYGKSEKGCANTEAIAGET